MGFHGLLSLTPWGRTQQMSNPRPWCSRLIDPGIYIIVSQDGRVSKRQLSHDTRSFRLHSPYSNFEQRGTRQSMIFNSGHFLGLLYFKRFFRMCSNWCELLFSTSNILTPCRAYNESLAQDPKGLRNGSTAQAHVQVKWVAEFALQSATPLLKITI